MTNISIDSDQLRELLALRELPDGECPDPGSALFIEDGAPGSDPGMLPLLAPLASEERDADGRRADDDVSTQGDHFRLAS